MCFQVFKPVIGGGLKISAEEIEAGLVNPDTSLAQLHITLLKVFDLFLFVELLSLVEYFAANGGLVDNDIALLLACLKLGI